MLLGNEKMSSSTVILVLVFVLISHHQFRTINAAAVKYHTLVTSGQQQPRLKQQSNISSRMTSGGGLSPPVNLPAHHLLHQVSTLTSSQAAGSGSSIHVPPMISQFAAAAASVSLDSSQEHEYKCAPYCKCSIIQVLERETRETRANLTQAKCESEKFSDILTIDRGTQIIHISLPGNIPDPMIDNDGHNTDTSLDSDSIVRSSHQSTAGASFRMPRLVQFNILRELVINNLKFQVCDSEVFKRGQKLRRLRLNHNQLNRIAKSCLRHLDKLIELNLDHNLLSELESALFSSLLNLRFLSIAHNRLVDLAAHQFANLTQLVSLNLVGNSFKVINLHLFEPMQNNLRILLLAKNEIKSFIHQAPITSTSGDSISTQPQKALPFTGVVFRNLIKLNVDHNQFERIKLLQLHRFFNVKFLSIRYNNIAQIRDKAFNGLKLIELNLAHNRLLSISKCSFCNATIKQLVLSHNNISIPVPLNPLDPLAPHYSAAGVSTLPNAAALIQGDLQIPSSQSVLPHQSLDGSSLSANTLNQQPPVPQSPPQSSSTQNVLILSQSILGPLFSQLEYLDLSNNELLANQLDMLLEPLLKLKYLNLANSGIDRSLPSPNLFKNQHQLKYLNLSHNQLDQVIAETIEPLTNLEVLDLSNNKFNELDESFIVTLDDLTSLRLIRLSQNPWFCSQCKVIHLYDWMLRSPIYNTTCIAPSLAQQEASSAAIVATGDRSRPIDELMVAGDLNDLTGGSDSMIQSRFGSAARTRSFAIAGHDYSLLIDPEYRVTSGLLPAASDIDFDLISGSDSLDDDSMYLANGGSLSNGKLRGLVTEEDDDSIALTMATIVAGYTPKVDYCAKCEFPGELRAFSIYELSPGDFKYCPGSGLRVNASDPKIGLTLAIVIIGALLCIIIVVIIMYRKKSNAYYPGEDTDHLESANGGGNGAGGGGGGGGKKQPVFSISSDGEHQYGDNTDYSSPPLSQSFESATPSGSPDGDEVDDDEEDEEELDFEDEDEELYDEDEEEEEIDEDEEEEEDNNDADKDKGHHDDGNNHNNHHNNGDNNNSGNRRDDGNNSEHNTTSKVSSPETGQHRNNHHSFNISHHDASGQTDKSETGVKQLISSSSPVASSLSLTSGGAAKATAATSTSKASSYNNSRSSGSGGKMSGNDASHFSQGQAVVPVHHQDSLGGQVSQRDPVLAETKLQQKSIMKPTTLTSEEPTPGNKNVTMSTPQQQPQHNPRHTESSVSLKKQTSGNGSHGQQRPHQRQATTEAKLAHMSSGQSRSMQMSTGSHPKLKMDSMGDSQDAVAVAKLTTKPIARQPSNGHSNLSHKNSSNRQQSQRGGRVLSAITGGGATSGASAANVEQHKTKAVIKSAKTVDHSQSKLRPTIVAGSRSESTGGGLAVKVPIQFQQNNNNKSSKNQVDSLNGRQQNQSIELELSANDLLSNSNNNHISDRKTHQQSPVMHSTIAVGVQRHARLAKMSKSGTPTKSGNVIQSHGQSMASSVGQQLKNQVGARHHQVFVHPGHETSAAQKELAKASQREHSPMGVMSPRTGSPELEVEVDDDNEVDDEDPDATSADSLAMEALDYLAASEMVIDDDDDDDDVVHATNALFDDRLDLAATPQSGDFEVSSNHLTDHVASGGALVDMAESLALSGDYEAEGEREDDDAHNSDQGGNLMIDMDELKQQNSGSNRIHRLAKRRSQLRQPSGNFRLKPSTSTHSALTQTGSLGQEECN